MVAMVVKPSNQALQPTRMLGDVVPRFDFIRELSTFESRMSNEQIAVILKSFEKPDEVRVMQKGRFELVHLGGMTIGCATYEPGWKWSEHVGPSVGATRCNVEHVGLVLSGTAAVAFDDGRVIELRAGELFYVPPVPHDSWVIGNVPYVSLHFLGAERYAR
jgi:mannose-6-phosphate isomerase-like protein (cupin superfamily)